MSSRHAGEPADDVLDWTGMTTATPAAAGSGPPPPAHTAFVGRGEELDHLRSVLLAGRGVALSGAPGVGKTRLAEELLAVAATEGHPTAFVRGRTSTADLPLGPFAPLLSDRTGRASGVALLAAARDEVAARSTGDRRLVLAVDDVQLLDPLSASLVQQLVLDDAVIAVLTARDGELVPEQITDLLRIDRVTRVRVGPLPHDDAVALAEQLIGTPLSSDVAERLATLTEGNPLFVTAVASALRDHPGGGSSGLDRIASTPTLVDFVAGKVHELRPGERDALAVVALAEPIGVAHVEEIADRENLLALERSGWLTTSEVGRRLEVRIAHPLYGEVLRSSLSRLMARGIYRSLAASVQRHGARRRDDVMRLALWSLESGLPIAPDQLMLAARRAGAAGDFALAARCARAAWDAARLPAAGVSLLLTDDVHERLDDPQRFIADVVAATTDPAERAVLAWARAYDALWRRGDEATADRVLRAGIAEAGSGELRDFLTSRRAVNLAFCGRSSDALDVAAHVTDPSPWVQAGVAYAQLVATSCTGVGTAEAVDQVEALLASGTLPQQRPGSLSPSILGGTAARALVQVGDVRRAEHLAREAAASTSVTLLVGGLPAYFLGWVLLWRGKPAEGYQWCSQAARLHRTRGLDTLERFGVAGMALTAAYAGQPVAAEQALRRFDELSPNSVDVYDADAWHARSALAALRGETELARDLARDGLAEARRLDRPFDAAVACTALLRLGADDDVLGTLESIGARIGGLAAMFADAAVARARRDVDALGAAAERYADAGAVNLAAATAAGAARAARRAGDDAAAAAWSRRAATIGAEIETRGEFLATVEAASLTRREHQVATLAAEGLTPRAIAERLLLSEQAVTDALRQATRKLGVDVDRLTDALAPGEP